MSVMHLPAVESQVAQVHRKVHLRINCCIQVTLNQAGFDHALKALIIFLIKF